MTDRLDQDKEFPVMPSAGRYTGAVAVGSAVGRLFDRRAANHPPQFGVARCAVGAQRCWLWRWSPRW